MAEELDIKVKLETELGKVSGDIEKLKGAGAFSGEKGARDLNKIQGLLASLQAVDLTKLKGPELTNFLNNLGKLRHFLDTAAKSLTNFSAEYKTALEKVEKATLDAAKAQDRVTRALEKQKNAQGALDLGYKGTTYKNASGRRISNPDTIASEYTKGTLKVFNSEGTELTGAAKTTRLGHTGIKEYAEATQEVEKFKRELDAADEALKKATEDLEKTPTGSEIHPTTKEVVETSAGTNAVISDIKTEMNTKTESDISATNNAIEDLNGNLNKQSSSLGKAFKQFTLYALALRTVKKALHEAVGTIKDLDKYLTEQAMVTGKTRKETYQLLSQYQKMAASLGATTKEVAEVATQFMRQGKTTADALTLTTAAISAAKVAGISASESVNYLTTALNGFQLSAQKAMEVSDKFAAIAAQSATSYEEIATALSKVAAQANLAGMSIDYTTALLAKGIETTREAPETIGTALKTVIARMRELGDYGETLEDGTDINNVETQLAYVGIALRDAQGELRSTEDVLDELGKKWDTLNSNQQAAIAKALAGTRQQSRLIAMMNDYERVTELQEIAQRSAGATAAQAEVYMEGMEAALNKVSVAWEKVVTTVTDSDVIINLITSVSVALDNLADFLSNTAGMVTAMVLLSTIGLVILGNKMKEHQLNTQIRKLQVLQGIQNAKNLVTQQKAIVAEKKLAAATQEEVVNKAKATLETMKASGASAAEISAQEQLISREETKLDQMNSEVKQAEATLSIYEQQVTQAESQMSWITKIGSGLSGLTAPLFMIVALWKTISGLITIVRAKQAAAHKKNMAEAIAENSVNATSAAGKIISNLGVWGIPIAIAVAAALAGIALAIGAGVSSASQSAGDKTANDINKLSNEIYKLTEKANAIKTIEDQFDALDKKIIKTAEDQAKLNELLDSAGDKLSSENKKDSKGKEIEGTSEQDVYAAIETDQERYTYLQNVEAEARQKANDLRQQQLDKLKALNEELRHEMLINKDNADYLKVQSAVRAIVNNQLYETIDDLEKVGEETEAFTQAILDQMNAEELYAYATEKSAESIKKLVDAIDNATTIINGEEIRWTEILQSDDFTFKQRIEAFEALRKEVEALGDPVLTARFNEAYQQWADLRDTMKDVSLEFMDQVGMTIDRLNEWGLVIQKFGLSTQEAVDRINEVLMAVSSGASIGEAIRAVFREELSQFKQGSEEWVAAYNKLLNAYQSAVNVSILNIGQSMEALHNRVNNIYEMAQKWNELTDTEKTTFMNDNADLFSGEDGKRLYEAFKTQNYDLIQQALENNQVLKDTIEKRKQELQLLLDIEEARDDESRNEGQIAYLKEQIKLLNETKDIYRASLKLRLEQEQAQLDVYKEFLSKQQQALEDSLNKRKEAYSKYFETINQEAEDEEYEEKANLLISNLSKLASSDDAASKMQAAELEAQLKELEQERLRELRERAQEAVINDIDDQLEQISQKFDELLNNSQLLLQAMTAQITGDPTGFVSQVLASGMQNMTALGAENYLEEFKTTFGSILPSGALDDISITESTTGDTLILNIAGTEIEIGDSTQQELYTAIMRAMRQLGINF